MPELSRLLREAAGEPAVPDLRGAMQDRRRRRTRRRVVAGALVILLALVGVGFAARREEPTSRRTIARPPADHVRVRGRVQAIADDGSTLWVATSEGGRSRVERFDATTGERLDPVPVDQPIWTMALGGDAVWVAGRDPQRQFAGGVVRIDRRSGRVEPVVQWQPTTGLVTDVDLSWDGEAMWATDGHGEVDRITGEGEPVRIPVAGQPRSIATATSGTWVELDDGTVGLLDRASGELRQRHPWGHGLFASSGAGIWTSDDGVRAVELFPELLDAGISVALGERYGGTGEGVDDVVPADDGVWVVTATTVTHWSKDAARADRTWPGRAVAVGPASTWVADRSGHGVTRWR